MPVAVQEDQAACPTVQSGNMECKKDTFYQMFWTISEIKLYYSILLLKCYGSQNLKPVLHKQSGRKDIQMKIGDITEPKKHHNKIIHWICLLLFTILI